MRIADGEMLTDLQNRISKKVYHGKILKSNKRDSNNAHCLQQNAYGFAK